MFWTRDLSFSVPSLIRLGHGERVHRSLALRARRLGEAAQPHHDDHPLLRSPRRRLRVRRRLAAAVPGRAAGGRRDRPRGTPPAVARGRDRPLLRRPSSTREPGSSARIASSAPTATRSSIDRTRSATRWSRCWPRRSRRPAGSPRRSSAISRATTAACCIEHFWVDDHFRDALGDETVSGEANIWPFYTGVLGRPAPCRGGPALPRCQRLLRSVPAALRDKPATRARSVADPPRPARLPGQHRVDQPRGDVPAGAAHGRSGPRRERDRPLRRRGSSATGRSGRS